MIEVGGKPLLWHIMKGFAAHGVSEFVVCLGYKGSVVKEYFANYFLYTSDVTIDLARNALDVHASESENWRVTLVDTGAETMTGGRLKRVRRYLEADEPFCMTYGDGVGAIDIRALVAFARERGTLATVTATRPAGRFGALDLDGTRVRAFIETPLGDGGWINGGFFVLDPGVERYLGGDATVWEREPMEGLARDDQLSHFTHRGFWQPIDTQRELRQVQELWASGRAPWKTW
jgi:glucose-1-phosphate cytidylyltransferase